jgi:hypothetical protein
MERLAGFASLSVARNHAKIILVSYDDNWFTFETSANLRSSDNLETMTIFNDREIHDFHAEWIDEIASREHHI